MDALDLNATYGLICRSDHRSDHAELHDRFGGACLVEIEFIVGAFAGSCDRAGKQEHAGSQRSRTIVGAAHGRDA